MTHFIAEFKHALSPSFCAELINKFNQDANVSPGRIGAGVDTSKKNSIDLHISTLPSWHNENQQLQQILLQALIQYTKAFPHFLVGAVSTNFLNAENKQQTLTIEDLTKFSDQQLGEIIKSIYRLDNINLQKYKAKEGNFNHWHSEHYPHPSDPEQGSLHRVLLWLIYLNDVTEGGETEFIYQKAAIKPTVGSIVIAPCGFTHTHRGKTPLSNDKYVLASWVSYRPAEDLYGVSL